MDSCRLQALNHCMFERSHHFQVNELVPLPEYLSGLGTKRKFRTERERKAYVQNELKLTVVKDPKRNCLCVPVAQKTLMLQGVRTSASRVKTEEHGSKSESKEAFQKAADGIAVATNTKDWVLGG